MTPRKIEKINELILKLLDPNTAGWRTRSYSTLNTLGKTNKPIRATSHKTAGGAAGSKASSSPAGEGLTCPSVWGGSMHTCLQHHGPKPGSTWGAAAVTVATNPSSWICSALQLKVVQTEKAFSVTGVDHIDWTYWFILSSTVWLSEEKNKTFPFKWHYSRV